MFCMVMKFKEQIQQNMKIVKKLILLEKNAEQFDERLEIDYGSDIFAGYRGPETSASLETEP